MKHKSQKKQTTITLMLLLAAALLPTLLPDFQTLEQFLTNTLRYRWLVLELKTSVFALLFLLPYYCATNKRPASKKEQHAVLELIENSVAAKYDLRLPEIEDKIEAILDDCAKRGFPMAQGFTSWDVSLVYKNELDIFAAILKARISEIITDEKHILPASSLSDFARTMLTNKSEEIILLYSKFIDKYFNKQNSLDLNGTKSVFRLEIETKTNTHITSITSGIALRIS